MLRAAAAFLAALGLVVGAATATSAAPSDCTFGCPQAPVATPDVRSGTLGVGVYGAGTTSGGGSFTVPARRVYIPPVCYYIRMGTGEACARALNNGLEDSVIRMLPAPERRIPLPGWEEHQEKGEGQGAWFIPHCDDMAKFPAYNALNDPVFVEPGEPVPAGEAAVSPEMLAEVAYEAMELPTGTVRWNTSLSGSGATLVGMPTWVWVEDGPTTVSITAEVPGVSATVDAVLDHLNLSAPGAQAVQCAGAGVAWTAGADPESDAACSIAFHRSTANQRIKPGQSLPTATLTVTATWTASWTSSLDPTRRELPSQDITTTGELPVAEVQTVVTGG